jgi:hypothetical protein
VQRSAATRGRRAASGMRACACAADRAARRINMGCLCRAARVGVGYVAPARARLPGRHPEHRQAARPISEQWKPAAQRPSSLLARARGRRGLAPAGRAGWTIADSPAQQAHLRCSSRSARLPGRPSHGEARAQKRRGARSPLEHAQGAAARPGPSRRRRLQPAPTAQEPAGKQGIGGATAGCKCGKVVSSPEHALGESFEVHVARIVQFAVDVARTHAGPPDPSPRGAPNPRHNCGEV